MSIFNSLGTPHLTKNYHLQNTEKQIILGNINFFFAAGAFLSVILVGYTVNIFGRIKVIIFGEILSFISYFLYTQQNLKILQFTRIISGMVAGINTAAAHICMKELLPAKFNVLGGMIIYVTVVLGGLSVFSIGYFYSDDKLAIYWRYFLCAGLPLSLVRFICLCCIRFDTPRFYFTAYGPNKARYLAVRVIERIYLEIYVEEILNEEEECYEEESKIKPSLGSLFTLQLRQRLIAGLVVNIGQQISGINFLYLYSTDLFNSVGADGKKISFIMGWTKVLVGMMGAWALNTFGRRPILIYGVMMQGISFLILKFMIGRFNQILFIPVCFYQCGYSLGIGASTLIYTADVLPPVGVGVALAVQWVFTSLVGKMIPLMLDE